MRRALAGPYRLAVFGLTAAVAGFLLVRLHAWPPHEDETLALFVSHQPLGDVFGTVLGDRGGAPLHFLLSHVVGALLPGLTGLRLISVTFAVASIPVSAALVARLADRRTALVATAIVAASWMTLFHGIYARMYSLFLFLSVLSFLALLHALGTRDPRRWTLWGLAMLATLASQPYGVMVLAAQAAYVLLRRTCVRFPLSAPATAFAAVVVLATPLWLTYRLLASRFGVTFTGTSNGSKLGSPLNVLTYYGELLGDFTAGWALPLVLILASAALGLVTLARTRLGAATLSVLVFVVPAIGLMLARSGASVSLESRHLIFALPFFSMLVAAGLLRAAAAARGLGPAVLGIGLAALVAGQIAWGWHKTPALYAGEAPERKSARAEASAWLAATSRPGDVLFGYEPLYLDAWEKGAGIGEVIVPRADGALAVETLERAQPLGRAVWVFDATDQLDPALQRLTIEERSPGDGYDARAFGPFLVIRTTEPVATSEEFFARTARVQYLGIELGIGDAGLNHQTALVGLRILENPSAERPARSRARAAPRSTEPARTQPARPA